MSQDHFTHLTHIYHQYINCLNAQDWASLGQYVHQDVTHNGQPLGVAGYQAMLEKDYDDIPDLRFNIGLLVVNETHVAAILNFNCSPKGQFLGLDINGKNLTFDEHVFYEFQDGKIIDVRSVLDKTAIEQQL